MALFREKNSKNSKEEILLISVHLKAKDEQSKRI